MSKIRFFYILIMVFVSVIFFSLLFNISQIQPEKKSEPKLKNIQTDNAKWYIRFSVKQQQTTAYTEEVHASRPANGKSYLTGGIAVHPRYPLQSGGSAVEPILPFGTVIYLKNPIQINGRQYKSFTVMDTGDVNYRLWPNHPYWFDVYFGRSNSYNLKEAGDYGVSKVDYYWYEEWK